MKRFIIAGTALLLCLSSCSFSNPFRPKIQSGETVDEPYYELPQNNSPVVMKTEPPAVSPYTEASGILCKVRHYNSDSHTKSDLIVQADGSIWCGFYMQNEGVIGSDNILRKSSGSTYDEIYLMDDKWLDAYISETAEDDFLLFGEMYQLGSLSDTDLEKLKEYILSVDASKPKKTVGTQDTAAKDYYYADITVSDNGEAVRLPVLAELGKYTIKSTDSNAEKACAFVMDSSKDYYKQWEELCKEKLS